MHHDTYLHLVMTSYYVCALRFSDNNVTRYRLACCRNFPNGTELDAEMYTAGPNSSTMTARAYSKRTFYHSEPLIFSVRCGSCDWDTRVVAMTHQPCPFRTRLYPYGFGFIRSCDTSQVQVGATLCTLFSAASISASVGGRGRTKDEGVTETAGSEFRGFDWLLGVVQVSQCAVLLSYAFRDSPGTKSMNGPNGSPAICISIGLRLTCVVTGEPRADISIYEPH